MQSGDEDGTDLVLSGGALPASSTTLPLSAVLTSSYTWRSEPGKTSRRGKRKVSERYLCPTLLLAEECSCAGMGLYISIHETTQA